MKIVLVNLFALLCTSLILSCNESEPPKNQEQVIIKSEDEINSELDSFIAGYKGIMYARVKDKGKYYFLDEHGERATWTSFDEAKDFSEGLAVVRDGDFWGYVDPKGNVVIECKYSYASSFSDGTASVSANGKSWIIDKHGNKVNLPSSRDRPNIKKSPDVRFPKFHLVPFRLPAEYAQDPISGAPLKISGLCGYQNENGKCIVEPIYAEAYRYHCVNGCEDYIQFENPDSTNRAEFEKFQKETSELISSIPSDTPIGQCITNNLRMRERGDMNSSLVKMLSTGEKVRIIGGNSKDSLTASINGKDIKGIFLEVETMDGEKSGWVFSGGLKISNQ